MRRFVALGLLVGAVIAGTGAVAGQAETYEILRKGGYTLFFRHAQADWRNGSTGSVQSADKTDACAGERRLSEAGRSDARALGAAVKSLNLPIGDVTAASQCRMLETAKLAFGATKSVAGLSPSQGTALTLSAQAAMLERLARPALPEHSIRVIIGDYEVAQALYGVTLAEGDALVLKTGADGKVLPVARVRVSEWQLYAPVAVSASTVGPVGTQKF